MHERLKLNTCAYHIGVDLDSVFERTRNRYYRTPLQTLFLLLHISLTRILIETSFFCACETDQTTEIKRFPLKYHQQWAHEWPFIKKVEKRIINGHSCAHCWWYFKGNLFISVVWSVSQAQKNDVSIKIRVSEMCNRRNKVCSGVR
jgi:hypothetical protein